MKINDVVMGDLPKIYELYDKNEKMLDCDMLDFISNYLERCECCGEITFKDELQERKMWNGSICKCCSNCQKEVDNEQQELGEPDPYDIYIDNSMAKENV